jgi:hypothetical protein
LVTGFLIVGGHHWDCQDGEHQECHQTFAHGAKLYA